MTKIHVGTYRNPDATVTVDEPIKPDEVINARHWYSTRQRLIVATFPSPEHARRFDELGEPWSGLVDYGADLAIVAEP